MGEKECVDALLIALDVPVDITLASVRHALSVVMNSACFLRIICTLWAQGVKFTWKLFERRPRAIATTWSG